MKIVVIGGAGLIGAQTVDKLRKQGHDVLAGSSRSGVNAVTGEGLDKALEGAEVVVDVTNAPSWEDNAVMEFFEKSTHNLLAAEEKAGVKHHVALSVVGTDRLQESGYFRAKMAQEKLIKEGKVPYTIVQATQFYEFLGQIAQYGTVGEQVHLSAAYMQPMASSDVADFLAEAALTAPINGTLEIGGPEKVRLSEVVGRYMKATNDNREVVSSMETKYYGMKIDDQSLVPGANAKLGQTRLEEWMSKSPVKV